VATLAHVGRAVEPGVLLAGSKDIAVAGSPLSLLADWMPLETPLFTIIASPGDLLVLAGIVFWLAYGCNPERTHGHADVSAHQPT
jgi:hypothetical protein